MTPVDQVFLGCAVVGATLFVLRLIMFFVGFGEADVEADFDVDVDMDFDADVGGDVDMDADVGGDVDADVDAGAGAHAHDAGFKLLSFQGITGFFMMFGLVGLALHRNTGTGEPLAVLGGSAAGLGIMWLTAKLFSIFRSLQSVGTADIRTAVGQEASVYLTIRQGGIGKVQVNVQERLKVLDAVTEQQETLATGARVKVVAVRDDNMLVVEKL
jgi:hypothetical protein